MSKGFIVYEKHEANDLCVVIALVVRHYEAVFVPLNGYYNNVSMHFCGYAQVKSTKLFNYLKSEYRNSGCIPEITIHGDITFVGKLDDNLNYIGFDCMHSGDNLNNCNKDFVLKEAFDLAEQIENLRKTIIISQAGAD